MTSLRAGMSSSTKCSPGSSSVGSMMPPHEHLDGTGTGTSRSADVGAGRLVPSCPSGRPGAATRRTPLVARFLRDLAAGADTMAALPRLDHLAQLTDDPLQLRDPCVALAQHLLQLGDALGVGHTASRALVRAEKQGPRARPVAGPAGARPTAQLIELNRYEQAHRCGGVRTRPGVARASRDEPSQHRADRARAGGSSRGDRGSGRTAGHRRHAWRGVG
jgi:hypothetical protein